MFLFGLYFYSEIQILCKIKMYSFGHADTKCQIYTAIFNILLQKYPQSTFCLHSFDNMIKLSKHFSISRGKHNPAKLNSNKNNIHKIQYHTH